MHYVCSDEGFDFAFADRHFRAHENGAFEELFPHVPPAPVTTLTPPVVH